MQSRIYVSLILQGLIAFPYGVAICYLAKGINMGTSGAID
jgi:hypothetical protein